LRLSTTLRAQGAGWECVLRRARHSERKCPERVGSDVPGGLVRACQRLVAPRAPACRRTSHPRTTVGNVRSRLAEARPVVHRTARLALRLTPAQTRRCYGLLRSGGDVWAALL